MDGEVVSQVWSDEVWRELIYAQARVAGLGWLDWAR